MESVWICENCPSPEVAEQCKVIRVVNVDLLKYSDKIIKIEEILVSTRT